jgi:phage baseplate assembly protein W
MGRYVMAEIGMALPFSIDSYGKVNVTDQQPKLWADRVRSVIGTAIGERVMRPEFGSEIPYADFKTADDASTQIENTVLHSFETQLSRLRLQGVTTSLDEYTGTINVNIVYALPNQDLVTTTLGFAAINGTNPTIKEIM